MSVGGLRRVFGSVLMPLWQRWQSLGLGPGQGYGCAVTARGGLESGAAARESVAWPLLVRSLGSVVERETQGARSKEDGEAGLLSTSTGSAIVATRSNWVERDAVSWALRAYLCKHKNVAAADASRIVEGAPLFNRKVVAAVKAGIAPGRLGHTSHLNEETCRQLAENMFMRDDVNVLEPFLESLGVDAEDCEDLAGSVTLDLAELVASMKVLEEAGIQRKQIWRLLERDRKLLNCSAADLEVGLKALSELGFSRREIREIASKCPALMRIGLADLAVDLDEEDGGRGEEVVGKDGLAVVRKNVRYLKEELGFSGKQIIKLVQGYTKTSRFLLSDMAVVMQPNVELLREIGLTNENIRRVLGYSPAVMSLTRGNIADKIQYLESLGVDCVGKVITRFPAILQYNITSNVGPKIEYLKSLGVKSSGLGKVLTQCPSLMGYNLDGKLKQTIAFLESLGLKGDRLARLIVTKPPVLSYAVDGSYAETREFLMNLGLEPGTKAMARAFASSFTSSVVAMQARFEFFVARGFPREWVRDMLRAQPSLLCLSERNLICKLNFFEGVVDFFDMPPSRVAIFLSLSLDARVKPRFRVMSWLKQHGHLPMNYSFPRMLDASETKFVNKYVTPYPGALAIFREARQACGRGDRVSQQDSETTEKSSDSALLYDVS